MRVPYDKIIPSRFKVLLIQEAFDMLNLFIYTLSSGRALCELNTRSMHLVYCKGGVSAKRVAAILERTRSALGEGFGG